MVCILEVRFQGDHGLLGDVSDLLHQVTSVLAFADEIFQDRCEKLLRTFVIVLKFVGWCFVLL